MSPLSIAGEPVKSLWVKVGPPLFCRGPRRGFPLITPLVPSLTILLSSIKLVPINVSALPEKAFPSLNPKKLLPPIIEFFKVAVPRLLISSSVLFRYSVLLLISNVPLELLKITLFLKSGVLKSPPGRISYELLPLKVLLLISTLPYLLL